VIAEFSNGLTGPASNDLTLILTNGVDANHDGLPDDWEQAYGVTDPNVDPDKDGLTNAQEYHHMTDPNRADTEGDGYSDSEEVACGSDPLNRYSVPGNLCHLPRLSLNTDHLIFRAYVNGSNPNKQAVTISNIGGDVLTPTVSANAPSIITALTGMNLQIGVNGAGLASGHYTGIVTVGGAPGSRTQDSPQTVTVDLWMIAGRPPVGYYKLYLPLVLRQ